MGCSRVGSSNNLYILCDGGMTKNVVYPAALQYSLEISPFVNLLCYLKTTPWHCSCDGIGYILIGKRDHAFSAVVGAVSLQVRFILHFCNLLQSRC